MNRFFGDEASQAALDRAAREWSGTPWRPNAKTRGVGASCHHAVAGVLRDAGFPVPDVPDGPADWSRHQTRSLQAEWLDAHEERFQPVVMDFILTGDVIGFQLGSCIHHLGIILPHGRFFQSLKTTGATIASTTEPVFIRHAVRAWRPVV